MAIITNPPPPLRVWPCPCGHGEYTIESDCSIMPDPSSPTGWTRWTRHLDGTSCRRAVNV